MFHDFYEALESNAGIIALRYRTIGRIPVKEMKLAMKRLLNCTQGGYQMCLRRFPVIVALLLAISILGYGSPAEKPVEATASVPALADFHEVIYKIWHEAWPNKDIALLKKLLPEVEAGIAKVASAQLPGILREKKAIWDKGVQDLKSAGMEYRAAAGGQDAPKLLAAAELIHSRFEMLMRAIRPPLKELDDFHSVLYMLYHHYWPNHQMAQVKSSAAELQQKMAALNEVKLPERLLDKDYDFRVARGLLSGAVGAFQQSVLSNDDNAIKDAIEAVHANYQKLEKILE
jgi:hypothetical protein